MRRRRFTTEQIVQALRRAETGAMPVVEICRQFGVAETTFYRSKRQ